MLSLDVGNTFAKWRLELSDKQRFEGRCSTEDLLEHLQDLIESYSVGDIYASWVGAEERKKCVTELAQDRGVRIQLIESEIELVGLSNAYQEHARLGVDRWLAMLAAWTKYKRALCVVDAGTALTIDLVNAAGRHLGGYIIPGYKTMVSALNQKTALIRETSACAPVIELKPGNNTVDAVQRGVLAALVGGIERVLEGGIDNVPLHQCVCVLTGGDSRLLMPHLNNRWIYSENLVLDGISVYAQAKQ